MTWKKNRPDGVPVSMESVRLLNWTPCLCRSPTRSTSCLTDRPSRSSFQTTKVSPSRSISSVLAKPAGLPACHSPCPRRPFYIRPCSGLRVAAPGSDPASRRAHSQSTWLVSRPVDAFLHRLHHFFVGVRSGVGVGGLPQGFLNLARHPLVILRPQRLLHAQRRLTQQVQQAEQPHVVGGDDALPNLLLNSFASPMRLWCGSPLVVSGEFRFLGNPCPALASASMVDVLISAAPVLFGESTGQGASTRKPAASRLSDTGREDHQGIEGWPSGVGRQYGGHSHQPADRPDDAPHVGHHAGHVAVIESGLVVAAQAALGSARRCRSDSASVRPYQRRNGGQRSSKGVKRIITATIATPHAMTAPASGRLAFSITGAKTPGAPIIQNSAMC